MIKQPFALLALCAVLLAPGVLEAWYPEWQKNLRSNGYVHQEVKWSDTSESDSRKPLNNLFSIRLYRPDVPRHPSHSISAGR